MDVHKIDIGNSKTEKIKVPSFTNSDINYDHVYYLINKYQNNLIRQGTHANKSRSEVRGGGAKPFKQKGTGRARRGTSRSPIIKGGGVIFAKTNRDYTISLNKKLFPELYKKLFSLKLSDTSVITNVKSLIKLKDFKNNIDINAKSLVIYDLSDYDLLKSIQNIKSFNFADVNFIPVIEYFNSSKIIFTEASYNIFCERYLK
tara:strand:- start:230 stop:835 length:606 start_codon:yes stop_codon:yes gene_type:complete